MVKSDLIENISMKADISHIKADEIVKTFFDKLTMVLANNGRVEIRGFGAFSVKEYKCYTGRNPKTGKSVDVKPKRAPFFKAGLELRQRVDSED